MTTEVKQSLVTKEVTVHFSIIVFNDDFNSFDHVIDCFIEILKHTPSQAEQCAMIIHNNGKYAVKVGTFDELEPYCYKLVNKGIVAVVTL